MTNFKTWLENTNDQPHSYAVVLLKLPDVLKNKINDFSKTKIQKKDLYEKEGGRETDSHVTILYGLENNAIEKVKNKIKKFKKFPIKLGNISKFDNKKEYDVLKIDIVGESLFQLNNLLKSIPHFSSYKEYRPHCTIAYINKNTCENLIGSKALNHNHIMIKEVYFVDTNKKETRITLQ